MSKVDFNNGWHPKAKKVESPNFDERPNNEQIQLIVIHGISLPASEFNTSEIYKLFCNESALPQVEGLKVSAHFLISRNGNITQFISCDNRAWHAGESNWQGIEKCNDFSIGIELEGTDKIAYNPRQYTSLSTLSLELIDTYPSISAITGHCHIAPERKSDPGDSFDWQQYLETVGTNYDGR